MNQLKLILVLILFALIKPPAIVHSSEYVNFNKMLFVDIPAGSYNMGSCNDLIAKMDPQNCDSTSHNDPYAFADELPRHRVEITKNIQITTRAVSVKEFFNFIEDHPPSKLKNNKEFLLFNKNTDQSVTYISWEDVQTFLSWLNKNKPAQDQAFYRLPTEAEWEYAARAGNNSIYFFGNTIETLRQYASYRERASDNEDNNINYAKIESANPWGLFEIYGNVWEWVSDWYSSNYYLESVRKDPGGPDTGNLRVIRGGSLNFDSSYCRSAARESYPPAKRSKSIGFRVVREQLGK